VVISEDLHPKFIQQVNQLTWSSAAEGFDPFAAILVENGEILATSKDHCIAYSDPTTHAEL